MAKKLENKTGMPVNLIIDELKSDDIRKRINSVKNLNLIAFTIGPERTRNELIPFISELLDDEDEVLIELVDSLSGNFLDQLGGSQHNLILIPILENLCKVEDSVIREKSSNLLRRILTTTSDPKKQEETAMNVVRRLFESDYFLAKSSLSMLIPPILVFVSSQSQIELIQLYQKLITDLTPTVRKQASMNFKDMIKLYPLVTENIISSSLQSFIKDEQEFVRMYVVDSLIYLSKTPLHIKNNSLCQNYLKQLAEDLSWRVRYYFCDKLSEISNICGKDLYRKNFLQYHFKFLQDPEPEMKSIAILRVNELAEYLEMDEIIIKLLPLLKITQNDQNVFVRSALASSLLTLCPILGKKGTSEQILPIFLTILKDQDSEVRITLFKKMNLITRVLGVEALSQSVIPALTELAQDKNWRIRAQTIEILAFFAKSIGAEFLNEKVIKLLIDWLGDKVYAVREAAVISVKQLTEILGAKWAENNILAKILTLSTNPNYLHRLTVLFIITQVSSLYPSDSLQKNLLPVLQCLSKDPVANIRLNVCKTMKSSSQYFKDKESFKKILHNLVDDQDIDVKYWAKQALEVV